MPELSERVFIALDTDCATELDEIIRAKRIEDFEELRQLLSTSPDADPRFRTRAIYALGRWGNPEAVGDIIGVMPVLDELSTLTAIDSLGRLGSDEALQEIIKHTDDPSPHIRKFTIHALGRFEVPEAKAKLIEIREKDPDQQLRALAADYIDRGRE